MTRRGRGRVSRSRPRFCLGALTRFVALAAVPTARVNPLGCTLAGLLAAHPSGLVCESLFRALAGVGICGVACGCSWVVAGPGRASRSIAPSRQARVWRSSGRATAHGHKEDRRPRTPKSSEQAARQISGRATPRARSGPPPTDIYTDIKGHDSKLAGRLRQQGIGLWSLPQVACEHY